MEGRLHEAALAQPRLALRQQQAVAEQRTQQPHARTLDEIAIARDKQLLDRVRMVDEQDAERPHARLDDVAVLPRARFVEAELVAAEMRAASGEEAGPRPREDALHAPSRCSFCRLRSPGGIGPRRPQFVNDTSPT